MRNLAFCRIMPIFSVILKFVSFAVFFAFGSCATNSVTQDQVFRDGQTPLISADGSFEFGFFSPPNSSLRYVGIWYSNTSVQSVVWVANRNVPIRGKDGSLTIRNDGNLIVLDGKKSVWSSNSSTNSSRHYRGILGNNGNFVITGSRNCICWQSFDHPTDTYLTGMKVHFNENKGEMHTFTSWKSESDPSTGNYSMGVDPRAAPQIVIWEGSDRLWRTGYFDGMKFTGVPNMIALYSSGFKITNPDPQGKLYFTYSPSNSSYTSFEFRITWDGFEKSLFRVNGGYDWKVLQTDPSNDCEVYNKCGANGYCSRALAGNHTCNCFRGFKPKYKDQWDNRNWSGGCIRKTALRCEMNSSLIAQDSFLEVHHVKLPDFADRFAEVRDEQGCEKLCLRSCSCRAFAFVYGIGCMTWGDELTDIQQFSTDGNTLQIRVADLGSKGYLSGPKIVAIVLSALLLCIIMFFLWKFGTQAKVLQSKRCNNEGLSIPLRKRPGYSADIPGSQEISRDQELVKAPDLPMFNYNLVASATNFFSEENKLGEGGFGPVYKGMLPDGQEIAVKKLSRKSGQGMEEFKNEILLIAKLQHRNLVRILGFCMYGEEKMLIYEYMPQKSLDGFIFGQEKRRQLDWRKRSTIIEGVARGLLYLHRDARCKIVHRDLKASNILLDQDMNAKISDFGMARMFGVDQEHMNTNRVVGTYGYMSPEYAMEGIFSEKSDVYSFGVLLLEIITGRRNTSFRSSEYIALVEYAWKIWKEGKAVELVDPSIRNSSPSNEVSRYVHIAMLCVQDSAIYRPVMSQVVLWLESDSGTLPMPKKPTLRHSLFKGSVETDCLDEVHDVVSLTISTMVPR